MAKRYCSSFGRNLTELAGSLMLVLQGRKTGRDKAGEVLPTHGTLGLPLCPTSSGKENAASVYRWWRVPVFLRQGAFGRTPQARISCCPCPVESVPPQTLIPSLHLPLLAQKPCEDGSRE